MSKKKKKSRYRQRKSKQKKVTFKNEFLRFKNRFPPYFNVLDLGTLVLNLLVIYFGKVAYRRPLI